MEHLEVMETDKEYRFFQFFGFVDGNLVGTVTLNGIPMHTLRGESGSISNNGAQTAVKPGENVIAIEVVSGTGEVEYSLLGACGDEDAFDPDHLVDLTDQITAAGPFPWRKEYGFVLQGPAFAVLKS